MIGSPIDQEFNFCASKLLNQVRAFSSHANVNEYDSDHASNDDDDDDGDDKKVRYEFIAYNSCSVLSFRVTTFPTGREQDIQRASSSYSRSDSYRPEFDWLFSFDSRKH